jgi:ABC-type Na+ efflux pump permease subunit
MTFLPIVARELRVSARRPVTYWLRCGAALAMIAIGVWIVLVTLNESPRQVASALFGLLSGSAMFYSLLSGIWCSSDSLSREKREGTLGLLFLTDLRGYDVVLGKLAATSITALQAVLAVVPMLAIPLLLGGITLGDVARTSLVTLNALFLSVAVGLCASALTRSVRAASSLTLLIMLTLTALLPGLGAWLQFVRQYNYAQMVLSMPSPGFTYFLSFETQYRLHTNWYWISLATSHALGWLALGIASLVAPHTWQDRPAGNRRLSLHQKWQLWTLGDSAERAEFRGRLLEINPFFWLASRVRTRAAHPWLVLALIGCGWGFGYAKFREDWLNEGVYIVTGILLGLLMKGWVAGEASRQMAEERQNGTLELLLSTPLRIEEILRGQWLALCRQFLWPVGVVVAVLLLLFQATLGEVSTGSFQERRMWAAIWLGGTFMFVLDLLALYWVGMWDGLTAKNAQKAASNSLARIVVLPWVAMALLLVLVSLTIYQGGREPKPMLFLYAWLFFGVLTDVLFIFWARAKLINEFRHIAAQKFQAPAGFWRRLFAWLRP